MVGAKLSEGINFSDNLARAVVICGTSILSSLVVVSNVEYVVGTGIPYPNGQSIELKERMNYLKSSIPTPTNTPDAGQILCQSSHSFSLSLLTFVGLIRSKFSISSSKSIYR